MEENENIKKDELIEEVNEEIKPEILDKNDENYQEVVEALRQKIYGNEKSSQRRSLIAAVIMFAFFIAGFVLFLTSGNNKVLKYVGLGLLGAGILTLIVNGIINRRIARPDTKNEYIIPVTRTLINHVINDPRYEEVTYNSQEQVDIGVLFTDGVYDGVTDMVSRSVFKGQFKKHHFSCGEVGIYSGPKGKGRITSFIGKYVSMPNDLHFVDHYVIVSKGTQEYDVPKVPEDIIPLFRDEKFIIFGKEGSDYEKDLGKDFINKVKALKVNGHFLNLSLGIWAGHTSAYLSFDDEVMGIPYQKPLNVEAIDQFKDVLAKVLELLESIA